jgi:hypothetical protein
MCGIPNGLLMGYPALRLLVNSSDQHVYSELVNEPNINDQHNLGVHPI